MEPQNATDHIAMLALMLVGVLLERLDDLGELDDATTRRVHHLVKAVRVHARGAGLKDLNILFDNIDEKLSERAA